ncbi:MAG: hypothetical protein ACREYE_14695, partial [Gammaproteobacteria bacterium]
FVKKPTALGISRSGGARNPHVFQYTLRFPRSGGTRPSFARDGFFTNSQRNSCRLTGRTQFIGLGHDLLNEVYLPFQD